MERATTSSHRIQIKIHRFREGLPLFITIIFSFDITCSGERMVPQFLRYDMLICNRVIRSKPGEDAFHYQSEVKTLFLRFVEVCHFVNDACISCPAQK